VKLGQYLFRKHGGNVVFFGRFIAALRAWAALPAGTKRRCLLRRDKTMKRLLTLLVTLGLVSVFIVSLRHIRFC